MVGILLDIIIVWRRFIYNIIDNFVNILKNGFYKLIIVEF